MAAVALTAQNARQVAQQNPVVVIKFWASWCGPCRAFAPIFDQVAAQFAGVPGVAFVTCEIDQQRELAQEFGVQSVPTVAIVKGGRIVHSQPGLVDARTLAATVSRFTS